MKVNKIHIIKEVGFIKIFSIEISRQDFENTIRQFDNDDVLIASLMLIGKACELNDCTHCLFKNGICRTLYEIAEVRKESD